MHHLCPFLSKIRTCENTKREFHENFSLSFHLHMRLGTRNKGDIRLYNCFSNARDKNWINGIEVRISIDSNKPINCTAQICIGTVSFLFLHNACLLFYVDYCHFAHYTIFITLMGLVNKSCSLSPKFVACNLARSQNLTFMSIK